MHICRNVFHDIWIFKASILFFITVTDGLLLYHIKSFPVNLTMEEIHKAKSLGSFHSVVSKVSTAYQRALSAGVWLHLINSNKTLPSLPFFCCQFGWIPLRQPIKRPLHETTWHHRIFFIQLTLCSLSLSVCLYLLLCLAVLLPSLFVMLLTFWDFLCALLLYSLSGFSSWMIFFFSWVETL